MTGQYTANGTGLSMVKVSGKDIQFKWCGRRCNLFIYDFHKSNAFQGAGPLSVAVKSLLLTGETFLVIK